MAQDEPQQISTFDNFLCSTAAALVSRSATYPLDTLKTWMQNSTERHSLVQALRARRGALFQGLGPSLLLSVPATGIYLVAYDKTRDFLSKTWGLSPHGFICASLSGITAEALAGVIFVPMEVIKEKLQVHNSKQTAAAMITNVYRQHGAYGFYRGYALTMSVYVPYSVAYFVCYEKLRSFVERKTPGGQPISFHTNLLISGFCAGIASAISNPMDVVHTRVQVATSPSTWKREERHLS
ncbi:hypothetical protein HDV03_000208 [Kappamyces sp. JEL0829]|nr:hypothetical protein HDV03_000208 [Kappamyces sp. JEL0829]